MSAHQPHNIRVLAVIQARIGSSRFPGKMLRTLLDRPVIAWTVARTRMASMVDEVVVATTNLEEDDPLAAWCAESGTHVFRGSELDVLDRVYRCASEYDPGIVIRVTGDVPLIDPALIDAVVERLDSDPAVQYSTNAEPISYPEGMTIEALPFSVLAIAWKEATSALHREHVTPYVRFHPENFKQSLVISDDDLSPMRVTVDYPDDLIGVEMVLKRLEGAGKINDFTLDDIVEVWRDSPEIRDRLGNVERDIARTRIIEEEEERSGPG